MCDRAVNMSVSPCPTAHVLRDATAFNCILAAGLHDSAVGLVTLHMDAIHEATLKLLLFQWFVWTLQLIIIRCYSAIGVTTRNHFLPRD
jgi:hypothetical protein